LPQLVKTAIASEFRLKKEIHRCQKVTLAAAIQPQVRGVILDLFVTFGECIKRLPPRCSFLEC